jgi:hypothetical protein
MDNLEDRNAVISSERMRKKETELKVWPEVGSESGTLCLARSK